MARRLGNAERALEEIAKQSETPHTELPRVKSELDELRAQQKDVEARNEAYLKLVRNVQALVDSGRLKVTVRDGRLHFWAPQAFDTTNPWQ